MAHGVIISRMVPCRKCLSSINPQRAILIVLFLTSCVVGGDFTEDGLHSDSTPTGIGSPLGETMGSSDVLQAAISTSADAILNGINLRRTQEGLLPWVIEPVLIDSAYERSVEMAVQGYLDHVDPGESEVRAQSILQERGYFGQAAELIFATHAPLQETAEVTLHAWFDDPDHKAVLLSPNFRYAGLGLMGDGDRWFVTLILVEGRP